MKNSRDVNTTRRKMALCLLMGLVPALCSLPVLAESTVVPQATSTAIVETTEAPVPLDRAEVEIEVALPAEELPHVEPSEVTAAEGEQTGSEEETPEDAADVSEETKAPSPVMEAIDMDGYAYVRAQEIRLYADQYLSRASYLGQTGSGLLLADGYVRSEDEDIADVLRVMFLSEAGVEMTGYVYADAVVLVTRADAIAQIVADGTVEWPWPQTAFTVAPLDGEASDGEAALLPSEMTEDEIQTMIEQLLDAGTEEVVGDEAETVTPQDADVDFASAIPAAECVPAYYREDIILGVENSLVLYMFTDYAGQVRYRVYGSVGEAEGFFAADAAGNLVAPFVALDTAQDPYFEVKTPDPETIPDFYSLSGAVEETIDMTLEEARETQQEDG